MNLERLVTTQVDTWAIKRRLEEEGRGLAPVQVEDTCYRPCLLISRQCGSFGGRIARRAGERLGWHVYDREIVEEISRVSHVREKLVATVDERVRSAWNHVRAAIAHEDVSARTYLHALEQVIRTLGHHGDVIILGRGAQYWLPAASTLRVRVIAPESLRVKRIAERDRLTWEEARRQMETRDSERAAFIRRTFQRDTTEPLDYDLVLNTGTLSVEGAVASVLAALEAKLGVHLPAAAGPAPYGAGHPTAAAHGS